MYILQYIISVKFRETSSKHHNAVERRGSGRTHANMSGMTMRIVNLALQWCKVQLKRPGETSWRVMFIIFDGIIRCTQTQKHIYIRLNRLNLLSLKFVPGLNIWGMTPQHLFLRNQCVSLSRARIRGIEAWTYLLGKSGCRSSHGPSFGEGGALFCLLTKWSKLI